MKQPTRKQKIALTISAVWILVGFVLINSTEEFCVSAYIMFVILPVLIGWAIGWISRANPQEPVNLRRGYRRITLLVSIIAALVAWLICVLFVGTIWDEERRLYNADKKNYDGIVWFWHVWDANGWEAGKKGITQYLLNKTICDGYAQIDGASDDEGFFVKAWDVFPGIENIMPDMPLHSLDEQAKAAKEVALERAAKNSKNHERWGNKSLHVIISLSVLAALPTGMVGFVFVWLIYFLVRWLILGFRNDTG